MNKLYMDRGNGIEEVKGIMFLKEDNENIKMIAECNDHEEIVFLLNSIINVSLDAITCDLKNKNNNDDVYVLKEDEVI